MKLIALLTSELAYVNVARTPGVAEALGYDPVGLVGSTHCDAFGPTAAKWLRTVVSGVLATQQEQEGTGAIDGAQGHVTYRWSILPWLNFTAGHGTVALLAWDFVLTPFDRELDSQSDSQPVPAGAYGSPG